MTLQTADIKKLKGYFQTKPVNLAYLMGSYVSGKQKAYSDIDLAVYFSPKLSKEQKFALKIEMISDLSKMLKTDNIDFVDLSSAPPALKFEAIKQRYEIYVKDEATRVAFETDTLSSLFDRQYYLRRSSLLGIRQLKEEYGIGA